MKVAVTRDEGVATLKSDGKGKTSLDIPCAFIKTKDDEGIELRFQNDQGEDIAKTTIYECYDKVGFLSLPLGQEVVNSLVLNSGNQSFYYVYVSGLPKALKAVVQGTLTASFARREASSEQSQKQGPDAEPKTSSPNVNLVPEPKKKGGSPLVKILFASCILLLALAAALWWFFLKDGVVQPRSPADPVTASKEHPAADKIGSPSQDSSKVCELGFSQDDKALLDACMASKPADEELLKLAQASFAKGRCMIGTRIYSSLGRTGAQGAALAYAQFFDPKSKQQSDCVKKDGSQARYWYEKALKSADPDEVNQAKEALKP